LYSRAPEGLTEFFSHDSKTHCAARRLHKVARRERDIYQGRVFGDGEGGEPEKVELLKSLYAETARIWPFF
jgi:hypothetical protein